MVQNFSKPEKKFPRKRKKFALEKNLRISSSILQEEYRKHSFLIGRSIRVKEKDTVYEGIAVDIAQDGGLIVQIVDEENPRKLIAAEVSILPNY